MQVSTNKAVSINEIIPPNWERAKDSFTCDEMIDAYFTGKEDGKNAYFETLKEKFNSNFEHASKLNLEVVSFLEANGISLHSAHLKPTPPFQFEVTLVVDPKDYLSDKFDVAYDLTHEITKTNNSQTFKILFYFIPGTDKLNIRRIISDGYIFSYSPDGKE